MDVVRQDRVERSQRYDFQIAKNTGFEMHYEEFEYPSELDRRDGECKRVLWIQERYSTEGIGYSGGDVNYWQDTILETMEGKITHRQGEGIGAVGYSPVFERFAELSEEHRAEIREALSPEALDLLNKGLVMYRDVSYSDKKPEPLGEQSICNISDKTNEWNKLALEEAEKARRGGR